MSSPTTGGSLPCGPASLSEETRARMKRYDEHAPAYRDYWADTLRAPARRLLSELADPRVERVLDMGAGTGSQLPELEAAFPGSVVVGADMSLGMLGLSPTGSRPVAMDAGRLAVRSESVDVVVCLFMLFLLEDPQAALDEARRVLRPGGTIAALTWAGDLDSEALRHWNACFDAHAGADPEASTNSHDPVDTPEKMEQLLAAAGFTNTRCEIVPLEQRIEAEHLLLLQTGMGRQKARFDAMSVSSQQACLEEARQGFAALGPEAFVARAPLVQSMARRTGDEASGAT